MKITAAVIRALQAVERGSVVQSFNSSGNVFKVPKGVSARICREAQQARLIEDRPGQSGGVSISHFTQRLTDAGRAALADPPA